MAKQTIGAFLQTLRKAKGFTQQEVADALGKLHYKSPVNLVLLNFIKLVI